MTFTPHARQVIEGARAASAAKLSRTGAFSLTPNALGIQRGAILARGSYAPRNVCRHRDIRLVTYHCTSFTSDSMWTVGVSRSRHSIHFVFAGPHLRRHTSYPLSSGSLHRQIRCFVFRFCEAKAPDRDQEQIARETISIAITFRAPLLCRTESSPSCRVVDA